MANGTLHAIAAHLARAVAPLDVAFRDADAFRALMRSLGWNVDGLPPEYEAVADRALTAIEAAAVLGDDPDFTAILEVVTKTGDAYRAISTLAAAPPGVDATTFLASFARNLFEYLLAEDLFLEAPRWFSTLQALGVIQVQNVAPTDDRPPYTRYRFDWEQIPAILGDPASIPARLYGWGTPDFRFEDVALVAAQLAASLRLPLSLDRVGTALSAALQSGATGEPAGPVARALTMVLFDVPDEDETPGKPIQVGLMLAGLPAEGTSLPGMFLTPLVPDGIAESVELGPGWQFQLRAGTDLAHQLGIVIRPDDIFVRYPFAPGQPLPSAGFGATLAYQGDTPTVLFGQPEGTRLELASAQLGLTVDEKAGDLEVVVAAMVDGLAFVLSAADLDGFLGSALGAAGVRVDVPMRVSWSSRTGLDFMAGAGFATTLYPHRDLGLIRFDKVDLAVRLAAGAGDPPELGIRAAISFSGAIGPISYVVDRVGVELAARFVDGNAGPFDLALRPLWPTGLGLAIEAGPIRGGGFISYDPEKRRYAGVLQLDVFDIGVSAIGILDTADANGNDLPSPGYSFIILVAVDFPPIQLGYGFTLNGVGGLAGLNRRLDATAVLGGIRQGILRNILFPKDPVRDAPTIISNLSTIFPIAMGRYVFGPSAIIGWGTPTLITIELAIVVELPAPVSLTLLGQATVVLPDPDAPIVSLHVDVIGVLDANRRTLAIDASLHDSHVAGFDLSGDLALRLAYGDNPSFALAVGGLNPHFTPPPGFPALRRVTVALGLDDNPRVSLEGYLAVTSNSLQFGAKAELYAAAAGFNVHGWLSFDALVIRRPLSFRFDFDVGMSLNRGSRRIAGVTVHGTLTGPNPFHAWGEGSLSLLFFDISVPFDATFGVRRDLAELLPADPWPLLRDAIGLLENWSGQASPRPAVSYAAPPGAPGLAMLNPAGAATLRQKVLPLNRTLQRFGEYDIAGPNIFTVADVQVNARTAASWAPVTDHFAPGDFERLSETDQLSRASFEQMDAGVQVGAGAAQAPMGAVKVAPIVYETKILDASWRPRPQPLFPLTRAVQLVASGGGAKAASAVGRARFARTDGRAFAVVLTREIGR